MPEVKAFTRSLERKLKVQINQDETLDIKWSPAQLTEEVWDQMAEHFHRAPDDDKSVSPFDIARQIVAPLLTWWDLTVDGEPYPITAENIAGFGLGFVMALGAAIQDDFAIGADTKKGSGGG